MDFADTGWIAAVVLAGAIFAFQVAVPMSGISTSFRGAIVMWVLFVVFLVAGIWLFKFGDLRPRSYVRVLLSFVAVGATVLYAKGPLTKIYRGLDSAAMTGRIEPPSVVLFSPSSALKTLLEVGDSGTVFHWAGDPGSPMFVLGEDGLTIERLANGSVAVTTTIRDANGKIIAELVRNEWKLRPSLLWDRNFNTSAVEVRGEDGRIVLQARAMPDRIRLQGMWRSKTGSFFELVKSPDPNKQGALMIMREDQHVPIPPLFRYPSEKHLGKFVSD